MFDCLISDLLAWLLNYRPMGDQYGCLGLGPEQPKVYFKKKLIFILFVPSPGTSVSVGMGHSLQQAYLL